MTAVDTTITCSNPQCRVAETGKCLEGLSTELCQNFGKGQSGEPEILLDDSLDEEPQLQEIPREVLPDGEALKQNELSTIFRAVPTRLIVLIGVPGSGKTSMIACLLELFQGGARRELNFSRSKTLVAFERICHGGRTTSGGNTPEIERTRHGATHYYHLELHHSGIKERTAFLIADRTGEDYATLANNSDAITNPWEVNNADHVTILVDGERLIDKEEQHGHLSELKMIIRSLVENEEFPHAVHVTCVLTKNDLIQSTTSSNHIHALFENFVQYTRKIFSNSAGSVNKFIIAAHPDRGAPGAGMDDILYHWLTPRKYNSFEDTQFTEENIKQRAFWIVHKISYERPEE
ncbi:hypothetical protein [Chromobacterium sp. Beijing]|uniref:TRAFAC clade GTPase domain-containing protein n=1 Tax=Chromobacterium sp. Beijing TaxID=2735795 RepID=UPI001F343D5A|nr:hypothetical protein [Chromobacterium sp. Beijing]UJB33413.1 hypothetical protein HQN78_21495 [Chromobacterium sp. Beijing]